MDRTLGKGRKRIAFTSGMAAALRAQAERTGVAPFTLLHEYLAKDYGITQAQLYRWMGGSAKTVRADYYRLLLSAWQRFPDADDRYVSGTPEVIARFRRETQRTGVGIVKLLAGRGDIPEGLSAKKIANFCQGSVRRIRKDHMDYVMRLWRALPGRSFIELRTADIAALRGHTARTGKGPYAILRGARNKPDGLTAAIITAWLNGRVTARKDHLDYVLALYRPGRTASR